VEWSNILTQELENFWKDLGILNCSSNEWSLETDIMKWALRFCVT
ncbi:6364_t:CDS:1, partial [Racocetra persica]